MKYQLLTILRDSLSSQDLTDLCLLVGADDPVFFKGSQSDIAKELIQYWERRRQLAHIIVSGEQIRPDIIWPSIPTNEASSSN